METSSDRDATVKGAEASECTVRSNVAWATLGEITPLLGVHLGEVGLPVLEQNKQQTPLRCPVQ